jgi:4-aminobutyrate aminotransferase
VGFEGPVPCAAGLATLEVIAEEGLLDNASTIGEQQITGFRELQQRFPGKIADVRGVGLMIGIEFATAELAARVQQRSFELGLLVLECGESSIRMSPSLVVTAEEARKALELFDQAVAG